MVLGLGFYCLGLCGFGASGFKGLVAIWAEGEYRIQGAGLLANLGWILLFRILDPEPLQNPCSNLHSTLNPKSPINPINPKSL